MRTLRALGRVIYLGLAVSLLTIAPRAVAAPNDHRPYAAPRSQSTVHHKPRTKGTRSASRPSHRPGKVTGHRSDAQFPPDVEETIGYRYAQLSRAACYAKLKELKLPVAIIESTHDGLDAPTRIEGALHQVNFTTLFRDADGSPSVYSLIDCRLVLAFNDFAEQLSALGVTEIQFSSAYRPPPVGSLKSEPGLRHAGGLAMDVHRIKSQDLGWLSVEKDFHGRLGAKVCGPKALPPAPATPAARLLRQIACLAHESHIFQSVLTPNYDRPHRNHLHFELTRAVRWFLIS